MRNLLGEIPDLALGQHCPHFVQRQLGPQPSPRPVQQQQNLQLAVQHNSEHRLVEVMVVFVTDVRPVSGCAAAGTFASIPMPILR